MTKQKELKRRVRGRMAKTGESYAAARAHIVVERVPPGFEAAVLETIRLARLAQRAQGAAVQRDRGLGSNALDPDTMLARLMAPTPPERRALLDHLDRQTEVDAIKLQTVMYVGRDGDGISSTHRQLMDVTPDKADAIRTMLSKAPLPDYLERGLHALKKSGIDPEADWATLPVKGPDLTEVRPARRRPPPSELRPLPCEVCGKDLLADIGMSMLLMAGVMTDPGMRIRGVMFVCKGECDRQGQVRLGTDRADTIDLWYDLDSLGDDCEEVLSMREWPPDLAARVRTVAEGLP